MITKEEKLALIKKISAENDISAYLIGQNTSISASSAHKILNGGQKNPRSKTLNIILEFLEQEIAGTENDHTWCTEHLNNRPSTFTTVGINGNFDNLKIDDKLNILDKKLNYMNDMMQAILVSQKK